MRISSSTPPFFIATSFSTICQTHEFGRATDALATVKVRVARMISRIYEWGDFPTAIDEVVNRDIVKIVIRPNGFDD